MSERTPFLAGNWKMFKTPSEGVAFAEAFLPLVKDAEGVDIAIAPTFTALDRVGNALGGSNVQLASQNVNPADEGAFTGEISARMLREVGCRYAIVGHSERRTLYGETSQFVSEKAQAALAAGIRPIVCVGETLEERESERTFDVIGTQVKESLAGIGADQSQDLVLAYEPVWAIGTGKTATPEMAQDVHAFIRAQLGEALGADAAATIRIQYGGSVKPDNATELMACPDIDGALVGGASLDPESFSKIVHFRRGGA
jgi:triosephosphate isomerase